MIHQQSYYRLVIGLYGVTVPLVVAWQYERLSFKVDWFDAVVIIVAAVAFFLAVAVRVNQGHISTSKRMLYAAVAHGFLFAILEEILFRGIIQNWLQAETGNAALSLILASIIFGLAHVLNGASGWLPRHWNWQLAGIASLGGLLFGGIYLFSQSLTVPIVIHGVILALLHLRQSSKNPPGQGRVVSSD